MAKAGKSAHGKKSSGQKNAGKKTGSKQVCLKRFTNKSKPQIKLKNKRLINDLNADDMNLRKAILESREDPAKKHAEKQKKARAAADELSRLVGDL